MLIFLHKKAPGESGFEEITESPNLAHAEGRGAIQPSSQANSSAGQVQQEAVPSSNTSMEKAIEQEVFGLEMGYGLLVLADKGKGGDLLDRITGARTNFAKEMGMLLPTIGVRDNIELEPNEYRFLLRGKEIARSSVMPDRFLAMNMGGGMKIKLMGLPPLSLFLGSKLYGFLKKTKEKPKWKVLRLSIHLQSWLPTFLIS